MPTAIPDKVVDASAVAAVLFGEPGWEDVSSRLRGGRLLAPVLLPFEVANTCWKKLRRHPGERHRILDAFADLPALDIGLRRVDHRESLMIADRTGLSAYDAAYLWLALQLDADLITLDRRLAEARAAHR